MKPRQATRSTSSSATTTAARSMRWRDSCSGCAGSIESALASTLSGARFQLADRTVECADRRLEGVDVCVRRIGVARAPRTQGGGVELGVGALALAVHRGHCGIVERVLRAQRLLLCRLESRLVGRAQEKLARIVHARAEAGAALRACRGRRGPRQRADEKRSPTGLHYPPHVASRPELSDAAFGSVKRRPLS